MKIMLSFILLLFLSSPVLAEQKPAFQVKTLPEIGKVKPSKPVKIHLTRYSDGKYKWDLTGDSVDEIIRTDKKLRKTYAIEKEPAACPIVERDDKD